MRRRSSSSKMADMTEADRSPTACPNCGSTASVRRLKTGHDYCLHCKTAVKDGEFTTVEGTGPWRHVVVVTTPDLPGHQVTAVHGTVFGLTVRSRNVLSDAVASVRGLVGGEVKSYTKLLTAVREDAIDRLREAAHEKGANAVIGMVFDASSAGDATEVVAYGTAVTTAPRNEP